MTYEKEKVKPTSKDKETMHELRRISTAKIIWFLVKRHKTGLLITGNIVFGALFFVPQLPTMIVSLFN